MFNDPYNNFFQQVQVTRVNGKNGADMFRLAPNSSILLLDETQPIVWLKTTDGAGYPTCTPYKIEPYKIEPQPDVNSLNERIKKLEEIIHESYDANAGRTEKPNGNADSGQTDVKRKKPGTDGQ